MMTIMQNGTYFTLETLSLANAILVQFSSRYVGVLFAFFDYLLESFGFKTCQSGGSQL